MKKFRMPTRSAKQHSGAALITGLIFLVVLTMIGVTAARMSTLEERMSGNMRDRSNAMQAAEMALRDAERDIQGSGTSPRNPGISGISGFNTTCTNGLCDRRGAMPTYSNTTINFPSFTLGAVTYPLLNLDMTTAAAVLYGNFTGAGNIAGLSAQPRYIIEGIRKTSPGGTVEFYYRITVRAQGVNPNTVVWLQEIFKP